LGFEPRTRTVANLKKLNEAKVKEEYEVALKNKSAALETLEDNGDISRARNTIIENIQISANESIGHCESKHHKPWFYEEFSKFVDRKKQVKLLWLQDM
jgi:hypothetical protein